MTVYTSVYLIRQFKNSSHMMSICTSSRLCARDNFKRTERRSPAAALKPVYGRI